MKVKVMKDSPEVKDLTYAHEGDAGVDLYANETTIIKPGEIKAISTGIRIEIEKGYEAQVRPKSGLALNHGITLLNTPGTIDAGYRGEIKAITINLGKESFKVEKGKKIAQIVFNKIEEAEIELVQQLTQTSRGDGGFGSTGLH